MVKLYRSKNIHARPQDCQAPFPEKQEGGHGWWQVSVWPCLAARVRVWDLAVLKGGHLAFDWVDQLWKFKFDISVCPGLRDLDAVQIKFLDVYVPWTWCLKFAPHTFWKPTHQSVSPCASWWFYECAIEGIFLGLRCFNRFSHTWTGKNAAGVWWKRFFSEWMISTKLYWHWVYHSPDYSPGQSSIVTSWYC